MEKSKDKCIDFCHLHANNVLSVINLIHKHYKYFVLYDFKTSKGVLKTHNYSVKSKLYFHTERNHPWPKWTKPALRNARADTRRVYRDCAIVGYQYTASEDLWLACLPRTIQIVYELTINECQVDQS